MSNFLISSGTISIYCEWTDSTNGAGNDYNSEETVCSKSLTEIWWQMWSWSQNVIAEVLLFWCHMWWAYAGNMVKSIIICKSWNNNTSRTWNRYLHWVWGENISGAFLAVILQKSRVKTSQRTGLMWAQGLK